MYSYTPNPNDKAYRKVDLNRNTTSAHLPNFTDIAPGMQTISCQPNFVLEILRNDGTTQIIGPEKPREVTYARDAQSFRVGADIPVARLYVRSTACPILRYKTPDVWKTQDSLKVFRVGGTTDTLELVGDPYFSARYTLIRR